MPDAPGQQALTGEALCARCAADGNCCCMTDPATAHFTFPFSEAEWQRIRPYAGSIRPETAVLVAEGGGLDCDKGEDILRKQERNDPEFVKAIQRIFPYDQKRIASMFPFDATHYRLRTTPQGSCVLLGETGCLLPREIRPWYCRLFPAWIVGWEHTLFTSDTCLIAGHARTPQEGLELLGVTPEHVQFLYKQLRADWGLPPRL